MMPSTSDYLSDAGRGELTQIGACGAYKNEEGCRAPKLRHPEWALSLQHPTCAGSPSPLAAAPVSYY